MNIIFTKPKSAIFKFINHLAFIVLILGISFYSYVLLFPVSSTMETYKILHKYPTARYLTHPLHEQSQADIDVYYARLLLALPYLNDESPQQALTILKPFTTTTPSLNTFKSLFTLFVFQSNPKFPPNFSTPNPIYSTKDAFHHLETLKKDYPNLIHRVAKYIKSEDDLLACGEHISFSIDYPTLKNCVSPKPNPTPVA
jgi:hypothetical protein